MSGSVLVLRVFGRVVAMFSFGVLLLLAACGGGGSGGVVRVQLDGVSPSSGGPGTLVELAGRFGLGTSFEVCGIPLGDLVFVDASGATVLPADMSLGVPYSLARGAVPEIPAGKACEVSVLLDGVVVAGAGGATVTFESLAVVPGVPTDLVASPGDGGASIAFTEPGDGGSAITNYEFSLDGGVGWVAVDPAVAGSPVVVVGLTNGVEYGISIRAVNGVGAGLGSESVLVTPVALPVPVGVPGVPVDLSAVPGDQQATIAFTEPDDGGSAILNYAYNLGNSLVWTPLSPSDASSPITVTGLTNGVEYSISVRAVNGVGPGLASEPVLVTPVSPVAAAIQSFGTGSEFATSVSALPDGGAIVTGWFRDSAVFGNTTLTSAGSTDVFVAKMASDGSWVWANRGGGVGANTGFDFGNSVSVLPDGGAIVTGKFFVAADFGGTQLVSAGSDDVFVARVSSNGSWLWAVRAGGSTQDAGASVSVLPEGQGALVTGLFQGTADFGTTDVVSAGESDAFVAKVLLDGSWDWATRTGGSGSEEGNSVSVLPDGSAIVTGVFRKAQCCADDFAVETTPDPTPLVTAGSSDVFVAKIAADGSWLWANRAGGSGPEASESASVLADGGALVTGSFSGTADFGGTALVSAGGEHDVFVAKVDADGSWAWAAKAGGTDDEVGYSVSVLPDCSGALVTGFFAGTAHFGGTELVSDSEEDDVFVARVTSNGSWVWAVRGGGTGFDFGSEVAVLPDGSAAFVTGAFEGSSNFGSTTLMSDGGSTDAFVARIGVSGVW